MSAAEGRVCTECREWKPYSEFYYRNLKGKYVSQCKECQRAKQRAYQNARNRAKGVPVRCAKSFDAVLKQEKECTICGVVKPFNAFHDNRTHGGVTGKSSYCIECKRIKNKDRYENGGGKRTLFESTLRRKYGLTVYEYACLLYKQDFKCALCGTEAVFGTSGGIAVDHCHKTGVVRGLLCVNCNTKLGVVEKYHEIYSLYIRNSLL